jgi:uncharacterized membrane protein YciS (DUF1049 family)
MNALLLFNYITLLPLLFGFKFILGQIRIVRIKIKVKHFTKEVKQKVKQIGVFYRKHPFGLKKESLLMNDLAGFTFGITPC